MSALIIFDPIDSEKSYYLILRKLSRDMKMESNLLISIPNVKKKKENQTNPNQPTNPKTPKNFGKQNFWSVPFPHFYLFWTLGCPQTFPSRSTNFSLSLPSQHWQKALVKKVLLFWRLEDVSLRFYLQQSLKPVHGNLITLLKHFLLPL